MNPVVIPVLSYDPQRDFAPISVLVSAPLVAMVHPSTGLTSIQSLIAYAKANPGKLNHASGGARPVSWRWNSSMRLPAFRSRLSLTKAQDQPYRV